MNNKGLTEPTYHTRQFSNNPTRSPPFTRDNLIERGDYSDTGHVEATPKFATCRQTEATCWTLSTRGGFRHTDETQPRFTSGGNKWREQSTGALT